MTGTYRKARYCLILKFNIFGTKKLIARCKKQMKENRLKFKKVSKSSFSNLEIFKGGKPLKKKIKSNPPFFICDIMKLF